MDGPSRGWEDFKIQPSPNFSPQFQRSSKEHTLKPWGPEYKRLSPPVAWSITRRWPEAGCKRVRILGIYWVPCRRDRQKEEWAEKRDRGAVSGRPEPQGCEP